MNKREYLIPELAPELLGNQRQERITVMSTHACVMHTGILEFPMSDLTIPATIIPHADPLRIITHDGDGYHVTALGDEVATVDQTTGEVCRKRPAVSRITVPPLRPDILAAILAHSLTKSAGPAKNVEMAGTLITRARAHLDELARRADKLAAKGQVEQ
jgi:hypothetical protein